MCSVCQPLGTGRRHWLCKLLIPTSSSTRDKCTVLALMESCRPGVKKRSAFILKALGYRSTGYWASWNSVGLPARVAFCKLAVTSHLPSPLTAVALLCPPVTSQVGPVGKFFSWPGTPWSPVLWVGQCPRVACQPQIHRGDLSVPTGNMVFMAVSLAFHSCTGKSSPHVVPTADGALLFPGVPRAVCFSVLGRL